MTFKDPGGNVGPGSWTDGPRGGMLLGPCFVLQGWRRLGISCKPVCFCLLSLCNVQSQWERLAKASVMQNLGRGPD